MSRRDNGGTEQSLSCSVTAPPRGLQPVLGGECSMTAQLPCLQTCPGAAGVRAHRADVQTGSSLCGSLGLCLLLSLVLFGELPRPLEMDVASRGLSESWPAYAPLWGESGVSNLRPGTALKAANTDS